MDTFGRNLPCQKADRIKLTVSRSYKALFGNLKQAQRKAAPKIAEKPNDSRRRCMKHSPTIVYSENYPSLRLYEYESKQWRKTFNSMGGLHKANLKEPNLFIELPTPYHCHSESDPRKFVASFRKIPPIEVASEHSDTKGRKEENVSGCKRLEPTLFPKVFKTERPGKISANLLYHRTDYGEVNFPKSMVKIGVASISVDIDKICNTLISEFGPASFQIPMGQRTVFLAFDSITSAKAAVHSRTLMKRKIFVCWCDKGLYNNGYFQQYKDYTVENDRKWQETIEDQKLKGMLKVIRAFQPLAEKVN